MIKKYVVEMLSYFEYADFVIELTERELIIAKKIADMCTEASAYTCMPSITIKEQRD